jgi:hypothetical protein
MKSFYLGAFLLGLSLTASAQSVSIRKIEVVGDNIVVTYDIADSRDAKYDLALYSSLDGFTRSISSVSGDVGTGIDPGTGKKITWQAKRDLGEYKGKLSLEIRGRGYTTFVKMTNSLDGAKFKKGQSVEVKWEGGPTALQLNIELYNGNTRVAGASNLTNNGSYSISIPKEAEPGTDYRVKISDSANQNKNLFSGSFTVAKKSKAMLFILPAVAAGGVAALLLRGGGGDEIETPPFPTRN